jgi:D-cysteine desulfhydrase
MNDLAIPSPPRLSLCRADTPLEPLRRLSESLGVELYVKRDDTTGVELSGNKVRKLEYLFAEARQKGADTVLTCGGAQSNHCRATALCATRLGLRSRLLLRTPDPRNPPAIEGNILLDRLAGAEIVWVTPDEYRVRAQLFAREAETLEKQGRVPYVIPEGGSNALGAWGYIRAAFELRRDLEALPGFADKTTTLVCAAGSGGTSAGLILGVKLARLDARVVSVNVCDDRDYFVREIGQICEAAVGTYRMTDISFTRTRDVEIQDGFVGRGYAQSRPEELALLRDVARAEGLILDPVYTGKAFYGMTQVLQKDRRALGERIVFVHTGGIFGLFPKAAEMAELL